jgi:hypothetical protein
MNEYYNKNHARLKIVKETSNNLLIEDGRKICLIRYGKRGKMGVGEGVGEIVGPWAVGRTFTFALVCVGGDRYQGLSQRCTVLYSPA